MWAWALGDSITVVGAQGDPLHTLGSAFVFRAREERRASCDRLPGLLQSGNAFPTSPCSLDHHTDRAYGVRHGSLPGHHHRDPPER